MISSAKHDGSWATIHSDDPASRGGAARGDVSPKAATGGGVLPRGLALGLVALSALVFAAPSEAQNNAPTGKPTIDGTPHVGEILTASVSGIADADGLTTPGYTYQWIRVVIVGGGTSNIAGATASTYTLTADDVTHRVRVRVMFTDDGGTAETATSDDYPSSGSVLSVASVPISFTATAGDGRVRLVWGNPTYVGVINLSEVRYQYRYAPGATVPDGTVWSNPRRFVQFRRLLDGLSNGTAYAFEVRAVNTVGPGPPATATATPMTVACPAPSLGNRRQHWRGDLTIGADTPTPLDEEAPVTFGFIANEDPPRASLSDIDFTLGAQEYGITAAWVGDAILTGLVPGDLVFGFDRDLTEAHKAALRLHVCGTAYDLSDAVGPFYPHEYVWEDDLDWEILPSRTLYLSLPPNNAATGTPDVTGAAQIAEVLTAAKGTVADADGLTLADAAEAEFAYTYQWLRVDSDGTTNPTDIPGATDARYTVTAADMGKKLKVRVSFTDDFNANEARTSDAYPSSGTVSLGKVVVGFRGVSFPEGGLGQLSFPEDVGTAVLTAYLDRSRETALSVPWSTGDQTAVSPDDYAGGEGTLTFAPGETEQTIALPIVDDAIREDPDPVYGKDESFLVSLEFGDDYRLKNSGVVEVLILDNDGDDPMTPDPPGVTVSPSELTVAEGKTVTYTMRLDSEPTGTVTVTPSSDNPDVTFLPATLTFTPSTWDTAQTVTVTAAQDTDTAEDTATLSHAVAGEDYGAVMAPSVPVTVPDDDTGGVAGLTLTADRTPAEGGLDVTVTATLDTPAPTGGTTVTLTAGGTADGGGTDYTLSSATIAIAEGETAGTVTITVIDDSEIEDGETIVLGAESTTPALTAPPLTLTIADNDRAAPTNAAPLAVDDAAETPEDTPVTIAVLANDSDPDEDTLTVLEASAPAHGAVRLTDTGTVEYTPEPGYHGSDRFTYTVGDGSGLTAQAAVEVTVLAVNDPPLALDDVAETPEDTPVTIVVLANDSDGDGDTLTVLEASAPAHGAVRLTDTGTVEYTPEPGYHGSDRFTYTVGDGSGLTAQAAVEVTVLAVNDPPLALDDVAETPEDTPVTIAVLANDSDGDGDTLTVLEASAPAHGAVRLTDTGTVEYTPEPGYHGSDRFTYVVGDGPGLTAQAAVEVTVLAVNDPPQALDDAVETIEDTPVTIAVLANDSDPDGDALALVEASAPAHGSARLTDAGAVEYTPEPDYHGSDRFTYVVGDGTGLTAQAAVEVTVLPVNDPPQALGVIPDQALEAGDGPASLDLSPFFEDRDGDELGYAAVASEPAVALSLAGATLTLTVARPGAATVTVTAQDPGGLTATQAFMVTTTDRQARGVVADTLAALGRGHLASARATLGRRVETTGQEQSRVTVAGMHVPLGTGAGGLAAAGQAVAQRWITGLAGGMPLQPGGWTGTGAGMAPGAFGAAGAFASPAGALGIVGSGPFGAAGPAQFGGGASPALSSLSALGGGGQTDFVLALGSVQAGGGAAQGQRWTVWGQSDLQSFEGEQSPAARYDGDLRTAYVGVDARLGERWLAGVAVSRSSGNGAWNFGSSTGRLTTNVTSVQPYLRWSDGGTTIWATAGGGSGSTQNERLLYGLDEQSDLGLRLGLVAVRRRLATVGGGVELQLRGDASWARLTTAAGDELIDALEVDVQQLRVGIDVSRPVRTAGGTLVEPFGEVHARHDGGSGQTGAGLEVAGGLRVARGLFRVEGMGRLLALHAADGYREHGGAVTLSVGEGARQPGLTLSLSPRWGARASASDALWQDHLFHQRAAGAGRDERALDARVDYGLQLPAGGLVTPFGIYGQSPYGRRLQVGLLLSRLGPLGLEVSGERTPSLDPGGGVYRVSVLGSINFGGAAGRIVNSGARSRRTCGGSSCVGATVGGHGRRAPLVVAPTRLDRGPLMDEAIVPPETAPSWQVVAPEVLFRTGPIAVIPFVNASGAASDDWIGAGMAETISVSFEQEGVSVVRRAKLSDDAGALVTEASETEPATERAAVPARPQPGAVWLVTGEYRRLGHRLEVAAWLVDTTTGEVSASVARVGAAAALFALQDDIAKQLRSALGRVRVGASKVDVRDDRNRVSPAPSQ